MQGVGINLLLAVGRLATVLRLRLGVNDLTAAEGGIEAMIAQNQAVAAMTVQWFVQD